MCWSSVTSIRRKIDRRAETDARGARDPLDGAWPGPDAGQERHGGQADQYDHGEDGGLDRAVRQQVGDERDRPGRSRPRAVRASPHRERSREYPSGRGRRAVPLPSPCRLREGVDERSIRGGARGRPRPASCPSQSTATSVTAHAPSARVHAALMVGRLQDDAPPPRHGTSTAAQTAGRRQPAPAPARRPEAPSGARARRSEQERTPRRPRRARRRGSRAPRARRASVRSPRRVSSSS